MDHGDLNPDNILIDNDEKLILLNFGKVRQINSSYKT